MARALVIIRISGPGLGLELNIKKTEIFWPSCNGVKLLLLRSCMGISKLFFGLRTCQPVHMEDAA